MARKTTTPAGKPISVVRVIGTFVAIIFVFFLTTEYAPVAEYVNVAGWLARGAAWVSGGILQVLGPLLGFPVLVAGTRLGSGEFVVDVTEACSGATPTAIYLAAVAAYPASWRSRGVGAVIGFLVIHFFNVLRVLALFLIGLFAHEYFHDMHVYVAQAVVLIVAVATWVFWAERYADVTVA